MPNNQDKLTEIAEADSDDNESTRHSSTKPKASEDEPPLGRALFRVMRALVFEDKPLAELDALPLAQLRLLMAVYYGPDATMKDFSERLSVSQSTVTQLAERLVRKGFIERRADSNDRRVVRLHTSAYGQTIVGQADALRKATLRKVWDSCHQHEQVKLILALDMLGELGEKVRAAEGRPLRPMPEALPGQKDESGTAAQEQTNPVNLMTRRVRGR